MENQTPTKAGFTSQDLADVMNKLATMTIGKYDEFRFKKQAFVIYDLLKNELRNILMAGDVLHLDVDIYARSESFAKIHGRKESFANIHEYLRSFLSSLSSTSLNKKEPTK